MKATISHKSRRKTIGKILLLSFKEREKEVLENLLTFLEKENIFFPALEYNSRSCLMFHGLDIDVYGRKTFREDREIHLTYTEFEILYLLARNPRRVFPKEQIYDFVWKEPYYGDYNIVMSHIQKIRKKIEDEPSQPLYIQTVWGVGYRFNPNMSSDSK